jgi:hypothetical protein
VGTWRNTLSSGTFGDEVQTGQTWKMESLSALLVDIIGWARVDALVLVLGAGWLLWWLRRTSPDPLRDLAACALATVCFAPHVMLYDAVLLILPVVWLATSGRIRAHRWTLLTIFAVQFTTATRHAVAESVGFLGWLDWAWVALPIAWLLVCLSRSMVDRPEAPGPVRG